MTAARAVRDSVQRLTFVLSAAHPLEHTSPRDHARAAATTLASMTAERLVQITER
jgi:hypothetical protein